MPWTGSPNMPSSFAPSMRRFLWRQRPPSLLWTASEATRTGVRPTLLWRRAWEIVSNTTMSRGKRKGADFDFCLRKFSWLWQFSWVQNYIWSFRRQKKQRYQQGFLQFIINIISGSGLIISALASGSGARDKRFRIKLNEKRIIMCKAILQRH